MGIPALNNICLRGDENGDIIVDMGESSINIGKPYIVSITQHAYIRDVIDVTELGSPVGYRDLVLGYVRPPEIDLRLMLTGDTTFSENTSPKSMSIQELFGLIQEKIAERENS